MHIALRCKKYQVSVKIKFFFQTPFFIDYKSSFAACVPCSVLSHLRIQCSFTNYFKTFWNFACLLTKQLTSFMKMHRPENNEVKWRFLYARRPRNFSHYLEHIKERDAKSYFPSDDHRSPFLLPRLSSEPMIISEITAKHKKAIRWDHHQALRLGNQNSHQPFMKYLLYSNGIMRSKIWSLIPLKGTNKVF